jgi:putative nucleotidyltransferase with HDIG domain
MYVTDLDRPWIETPFNVHGFRLNSEEHLRLIQQLCDYAYITAPRGKSINTSAAKPKRVQYPNTVQIDETLPQAKAAYNKAKNIVSNLLGSVRLGQSFETQTVKKIVTQCVENIIENPNAMLWLGLLRNVDEYTAEHSLNVGLLSIIIGRAEGLPKEDLETIGLCGMLHDMGKAKVPLEVLNKPGALTDKEFALMKSHTTLGFKMLQVKSDLPSIVADVAHGHHERLNGKGYPKQLSADDIPYFYRIVAIADTYDAITSARCYSSAKSSLEGLQILMGAQTSHFDKGLVQQLVGCIGIYPAGSIAELTNGEVGVIIPSPGFQKDSPRILVVRGKDKKPCKEYTLDLSKKPKDNNGNIITIRNLLSDGLFDIHLAGYIEKGTETMMTS